jgi:subtilisin-like proprotein convertase family protein
LGCNADCTFDQTMCDTCGNGTVEGADQCDGNALGAQTCADQGFTGGALDCGNDCTFDTAQCSNDVIAICSTPGSSIDSGNPTTTDTITVPNMGNIADVDVFLDITHTYDGDLDISLSADGLGVSNDLVQDQCGTSEDVWAVFNDEGSAAPADNCDEPYGIEGNLTPLTALSAYDGMEASGEWTLSVTDDAGGDSGTLNEWCLYLTLE